MSEQTKIAWCDSTINFWSGCTKVSDGCKNCYAETLSDRFGMSPEKKGALGLWGNGAPRKLHESAFKLAAKLNRKPWVCDECGPVAKGECKCVGSTSGRRRRIFSLSLGDWLDPEVPVEWLGRMLDTIRKCPDVDWLLCTKRPELWQLRMAVAICQTYVPSKDGLHEWMSQWLDAGTPPPNIVLLTSVENQQAADKRIPELLRIPARVRGLSCEPLLGPVDLGFFKHTWRAGWVIIGGESGNKARPCNVEWVRSLKDQCKAAGVPCFVKQVGSNAWSHDDDFHCAMSDMGAEVINFKAHTKDKKGGDWNEWPEDLRVREFYNSN